MTGEEQQALPRARPVVISGTASAGPKNCHKISTCLSGVVTAVAATTATGENHRHVQSHGFALVDVGLGRVACAVRHGQIRGG